MNEKRFAEGIYFNEKHEKAPDFILGSISVNAEKFAEWIRREEPDEKGYIRLKIVKSKQTGKPYIEVDSWKPNQETPKDDVPVIGPDGEEVPF